MITKDNKKEKNRKRHSRIRKKIVGTVSKPRLSVYKSNKHIYVQIIDDSASKTLLSCSTIDETIKSEMKEGTWTIEAAQKIGEKIAKAAIGKGIKQVIFDRGGNLYHGKIKALADSAREAGLTF